MLFILLILWLMMDFGGVFYGGHVWEDLDVVLMPLGWSVATFWSVFRQIWVLVPLSVRSHVELGVYRVFRLNGLVLCVVVLGACTLDVGLRLVCTGLRLIGGISPKSTSSRSGLMCPGVFLGWVAL